MEIILKHTVEEVNYILQALSHRPFAEVADLIAKIKAHAISQLAEIVPEKTPEVAPDTAPTPDTSVQ